MRVAGRGDRPVAGPALLRAAAADGAAGAQADAAEGADGQHAAHAGLGGTRDRQAGPEPARRRPAGQRGRPEGETEVRGDALVTHRLVTHRLVSTGGRPAGQRGRPEGETEVRGALW